MPRDSRESRARRHCFACGEPISRGTKTCPHCEEVQPSGVLSIVLATVGVFAFLIGFLVGMFSIGMSSIVGFVIAIVGLALAVGSYSRYLDIQAAKRGRLR